MTENSYAVVARVRLRELKSRLGLAAFIGAVAWIFAPSIWPPVWLLSVAAVQGLDWLVCRPLRLHPDQEPKIGTKIACCLVIALSVIVYGGMAAYTWFAGGAPGKVFAMILSAGGLLHVSLHMHYCRALLLSAVIPHATYFLGLPILSAVADGQPSNLLITLGCALYMTHLVVAVRQSSLSTRVLVDANRIAGEERQRAEVASAAKSDFLAVVSHEIRTPMNAVISAANLLRRTRLDKAQQEHVSMLLDAGDVLLGLLNDVLDFSKIEAGKMELELAPMNVREKLEGLKRLWGPRAKASGLTLRLDIAPDVPERVAADALRLQQILFNLMSNAVKFTVRGEIDVSVAWQSAQGHLVMAVRDTGCGIAEAHQEHIFNSFEQADAGTTRRFGGTGLGLAISRRLAELMSGQLEVASREGEGSTFTLTLPVAVIKDDGLDVTDGQGTTAHTGEATSHDRTTLAGPSSIAGLDLLIAEDHEVNRRILTLLLEPHGCRLTLVVNGLEAVEAASVRRFDAILMDMQMPVMDGLEASRRIRSNGPNVDTPLIALTANAMDIHRAAWAEVGADAFLTKPIDPSLLVRTILERVAAAPHTEQYAAG